MLKENAETEFKETYSRTILKDVVAFANTDGGAIYIGVNDDGEVTGLAELDKIQNQLTNSIKDTIMPDIIPFVRVDPVEIDGRQVIKVTVAVGSERPYFLKEKGLSPEGVYVRRGSSCQPLGTSGIRDMIIATSGKSFEEGRSLVQELTFSVFEREMKSRNLEIGAPQLQTLRLIGNDGLYTNLALLLSDQCPYTVKVAVFQGRDKTIFRNRKEFSGSLLKQLEEVYGFIDIYNKTKSTFKGLYRKDERDYPEDALREALLNSIIHRDYSFGGSTIVNIFEDHVEFVSLGGLVPGLSMEAILLGVSRSRNPNLAAVFYRMEIVESYGTGIDKIFSLYNGFPARPVFQTAEGAFRVILYNRNEAVGAYGNMSLPESEVRDKRDGLLAHIETYGQITRKEAETLLGVGTTAAYNALKTLSDAGYIRQAGAGKNSKYILNGKGQGTSGK
ncbi:MAG: putative DNA binding domain-containing protein [Clostridia bacterium]|nr:putative DNA binding domain-containing protein [Clostridia bacterium]